MPSGALPNPSRRVLLAALAGTAAGCAGSPVPDSARPHSTSAAATPSALDGIRSATTPSAAAAVLPRTTPWRPDPSDVQPAAKLTAVRRVETSLSGPGRAGQVLTAQYGGILERTASVLVVTRQWAAGADDAVHETGAGTFDVRLEKGATDWRVTEVHEAEPGPALAALSAAARAVLAEPRIALPPSALADVHAGTIHDSVLTALLALSRTYSVGVSILRSGHPLLVFGTTRHSEHPLGRAVDTWAIDGQPVVDQTTPRSLVRAYMEAWADLGSHNVGGPLVPVGRVFFSDPTHHDHVHAGFSG